MKRSLLIAAMLLGLCVTSDANAQPAGAQPTGRAAIECGAAESKRKSCQADVSAGVVLVDQEGEASCVLGQTWGFDAQGVWAANGCRGTFAFTDDRPTVSCNAAAGGRQVCEADTAKGVALASGSPACVQGKTWGHDEDGVWVADGCTATFVLTTRGGLTCGADASGRRHCDANTSAGVVLARSTGTASCVLGESWGYDSTGVWADRGCQGEFVLGENDAAAAQDRDLDAFFGRFEPYVRGLGGDAEFVTVGARLDWRAIEAGLVWARERNGDLARVLVPGSLLGTPEIESIVFDAHGVELFARVNFPSFALIGGLNDYRPDVVDPLLHRDFRVRYGILGAELQLASSAYLYAEARLFDDSVGPQGQQGFNVLAVGLHYGFSFKGFHRQ